jgi:hypothetical protein
MGTAAASPTQIEGGVIPRGQHRALNPLTLWKLMLECSSRKATLPGGDSFRGNCRQVWYGVGRG